jgi:hypothetical protein
LDPERFELLPGVEVRREFLFEADDPIAGPPIQAEGNRRDPLGGVFHEGDFRAVGSDELGGGHSNAFVRGKPLVVMEAAIVEAIVGEELHGFGRAAAKRRDGGVVQVDEIAPDGKLVGVPRTGNSSAYRSQRGFSVEELMFRSEPIPSTIQKGMCTS